MKKLKYLIIHCTDTPSGMIVTSEDIKRWHTLQVKEGGRGWKQIGYRSMIHIDGYVEDMIGSNGDDWVNKNEITNGAKGYNSVSEHIVYVGGKGKDGNPFDTRTDIQKKAMANYVKYFLELHPGAKVIGHNEVSAKACPSFNVQEWLKSIGINQ